MKKIMFTGNTLSEEEIKNYYGMGYQIDPYDTNLTNEEIMMDIYLVEMNY